MSLPLPVIQNDPAPDAAFVVEVRFKGNRVDYFNTDDEGLRPGEWVVVEVERGQDVGKVKSVGGIAAKKCGSCSVKKGNADAKPAEPSSRVMRRAEATEVQKLMVLRADEERVRRKSREMVAQHGLKMKVTETEWQWDRNKLTLYFTAERRVDFRQLVRELAKTFHTRIELKQIGVRDEAALLGGVGRCGRELCCSTWLREIKPISLQLAKDQNLSLNPAQISGTCGRLMCCLTYEHDAYLQARKRFPREGKIVRTGKGQEKVIGIDIWRDLVTLLDEQRQRRVVTLSELKAETANAAREEPQPVAAATAEEPASGNASKRRRRGRGRSS
ncbi:MAG TPA: regulatory iron-sulfur-containing complex subunit RicT [Longimicrobiaceae bacterium]|nr:regulatory iron-sulfur-containing complex subunit RicT [Longimicrobiaceae bacterium]